MRGRFPMMQPLGVLFAVVVFVAAGSVVQAAKAKKEKAGRQGQGDREGELSAPSTASRSTSTR